MTNIILKEKLQTSIGSTLIIDRSTSVKIGDVVTYNKKLYCKSC